MLGSWIIRILEINSEWGKAYLRKKEIFNLGG